MGYIVSRDCSISVTVSREITKNVAVKREEKNVYRFRKKCLSFQNTFQQIQRFTFKIPNFYRLLIFRTPPPPPPPSPPPPNANTIYLIYTGASKQN